MSRHLDSSTTTQMALIMGPVWKIQSFLLSEICMVPLAGLLWEKQVEKILLKHGWEKVSKWECLSVHREKGYSYLFMWMTSNWLERYKILIRCGKYSTKKSIWENQHLSWITYTWAALNDNVKKAKILLTITEPCLNRDFPRVELKKLPCLENISFSSWSYDMEGHARKCVERYCE